MKTLVIRHYTGPLFRGGTEFGWREGEGGPVDWFNSTGNGDVYIQKNLQEYRQVCGFEFEIEDQRQAGESITTEPCPTCRAPATCRHLSGTHVWDCPNCGEIIATVGYDCPDCASRPGAADERSE